MKTDYADFLSPMLVKELRQGVRNRAFLSTFILLQVAMLLTMVAGLLSASENDVEGSTVFFWVLVGASVLLVLPMSGMNAIGGEIRANTLELIFLTRLTSLRIVAGKWLAIFASSVLLVCAVLPYLVLRYFIGGVNVSTELIVLFSILGGSALLTAITVGLSAYQTRLARGFLGVFIFFALQGWALPYAVLGMGSSGPSLGFATAGQIGCLIVGGLLLLMLMLDVGAAKIAPAAENHPAIQRTLALALLALAAVASWFRGDPGFLILTTFLVCVLVCAAAMCEQPRTIPSLYRPFAARGSFGRFLGRFLYPGWHTALWFTTLVFAGYAALMVHTHLLNAGASMVRFVAAFGTLILPVAITRVFLPKTDRPVVMFFAIQVICLVATVLGIVIDQAAKTKLSDLITFLPVAALMHSVDPSDIASLMPRLVMPLLTVVSWLVLAIQSLRIMPQTRALEKESLAPAQTGATPAADVPALA